MEAEERPSKLRKLNHDDGEPHAVVPATTTYALPRSESASNADIETANTVTTQPRAASQPKTGKVTIADLQAQVENITSEQSQLSKKQLKRLLKKQAWEAGRDDRKAKRRSKAKEKKARQRAEREEQQEQSGQQDINTKDGNPRAGFVPRIKRQRLPVAFVVDCGFDDLMVLKERISLGSQITRVYSDNTKLPFQAHLYVSSWGGELKERFEGLMRGMYKNWKGIEFTEEDFVAAAQMAEKDMKGIRGGKMVGTFQKYAPTAGKQADEEHTENDGDKEGELHDKVVDQRDSDETKTEISENITPMQNGMTTSDMALNLHPSLDTLKERSEVIYLTSDSPYTLTELKPYHTYIVGGLVDKNRHKGICYKTARNKDSPTTPIKTAKLPIGEYMEMTARHVLATNHVVEIMLQWLETGDWGESFMRVLPKRKGAKLRNATGNKDGGERNDGGTADNSTSDESADDGDNSEAGEELEFENDNANGEEVMCDVVQKTEPAGDGEKHRSPTL